MVYTRSHFQRTKLASEFTAHRAVLYGGLGATTPHIPSVHLLNGNTNQLKLNDAMRLTKMNSGHSVSSNLTGNKMRILPHLVLTADIHISKKSRKKIQLVSLLTDLRSASMSAFTRCKYCHSCSSNFCNPAKEVWGHLLAAFASIFVLPFDSMSSTNSKAKKHDKAGQSTDSLMLHSSLCARQKETDYGPFSQHVFCTMMGCCPLGG
eukprot:scaffold13405_cov58-Attheya_sp.AAC.1